MTEDYDEKYAYEATRLLHPCGVPLFFSYHPVVCASLRPPATICEPSGLNPVPDCDFRSVLWIAVPPEVCRLRIGGYRRLNLRVFPYYLPFIIRGSTLWVLAVAYDHRKPEYWIQRKRDSG